MHSNSQTQTWRSYKIGVERAHGFSVKYRKANIQLHGCLECTDIKRRSNLYRRKEHTRLEKGKNTRDWKVKCGTRDKW
jgi:hypothetical protein